MRFRYCKTHDTFWALMNGWYSPDFRFYKHPRAVGLYVWLRDTQHHWRLSW